MTHYMTSHKSSIVTVFYFQRALWTVKVSRTLTPGALTKLLNTSHGTITNTLPLCCHCGLVCCEYHIKETRQIKKKKADICIWSLSVIDHMLNHAQSMKIICNMENQQNCIQIRSIFLIWMPLCDSYLVSLKIDRRLTSGFCDGRVISQPSSSFCVPSAATHKHRNTHLHKCKGCNAHINTETETVTSCF